METDRHNKEQEEVVCATYAGPDRRAVIREHWHTSKTVPISIIFAILVQTAVLIIWASTFRAEFVAFQDRASERFTNLEHRVGETYDKDSFKAHLALRDQKIETVAVQLTNMNSTLTRMYDKVDKKFDECERRLK